ncbi:hypothetical protein KR009_001160, partial [Drosophila setifemur]
FKMGGISNFLPLIPILLMAVELSLGKNREFVPDRVNFFSDCEDSSQGQSINTLADFSNVSFKRGKGGIVSVSGSAKTIWDIQQSDRIEADIDVFLMDHGKWKPTAFKSNVKNFCNYFFDKNSLTYPFFPEHVINKEEVTKKCFSPDTVFYVEPYLVQIKIGLGIPIGVGHYKAVLKLSAFDNAGKMRPNKICTEIVGDVV